MRVICILNYTPLITRTHPTVKGNDERAAQSGSPSLTVVWGAIGARDRIARRSAGTVPQLTRLVPIFHPTWPRMIAAAHGFDSTAEPAPSALKVARR